MLATGLGQPRNPLSPLSYHSQPAPSHSLPPAFTSSVIGAFKNGLSAVGVAESGCGLLMTRKACIWALLEFITNPADRPLVSPMKFAFFSCFSHQPAGTRPPQAQGTCLDTWSSQAPAPPPPPHSADGVILPISHRAEALRVTVDKGGLSSSHRTLVNV